MNALEEEEFADGECIVREGETGLAFYILQSGEISVHMKDEGKEGEQGPVVGDDGGGIGGEITTLT